MQLKGSRPHFVRSSTREKIKPTQNSYRLIGIIFKNLVIKQYKKVFNVLKRNQNQQINACITIQKHFMKNLEICRIIAWNKIKSYAKIKVKDQKIMKHTISILQKIQQKYKTQAFLKIATYCLRKSNIQHAKRQKICNTLVLGILTHLHKKNMKEALHKIKHYKAIKCNEESKIKMIGMMTREIQDKNLLRAWAKLIKASSAENKDIQYELRQSAKKIDALRKQLALKDDENQDMKIKLQNQRETIRMKTISDIETANGNRSCRSIQGKRTSSVENKKSHSNEKDDKKSDNGSQRSVLSWLNNSFFSFKSGKSSQTIKGVQCFCAYRQKYNQYKYQAASLKNQLQIIKNELEVTKDVNQHLQQEISNFYGVQDDSYELERLRKEYKQIKKERDMLKQKMFKYQKYVANLKSQFKNKIESLYRNIKKNQ